MSYSQYGVITATDYNNLTGGVSSTTANTLNAIWGTGSGNMGYGQTAQANVSIGDAVTPNSWANLVSKTASAASHQGSSITSVTAPTSGSVIKYLSGIPTNLQTIYSNRLNAQSVGGNTANTVTYGSTWNANLIFTHTATFANSDAARYFFNAGGQIKITCSHPNGSSINTIFNGLASNVGTIVLSSPTSGTATIAGTSYNGVTKIGGGGTDPIISTNSGFYALTTANTTLFTQGSGTFAYLTNRSTTGNPGNGRLLWDDEIAASSHVSVSILTNNGTNIATYLQSLQSSDTIIIQDSSNGDNYQIYTVTGSAVNNTSYYKIPVSIVTFGGTGGTNFGSSGASVFFGIVTGSTLVNGSIKVIGKVNSNSAPSTVTLYTVWDEVPDGYTVSTGSVTTVTAQYPETTYLANTWGSVSLSGSATGANSAVVTGQVAYTTPGTYTWTAPAGVTSVSVVAVGPGSDQMYVWSSWAGGGGGLAYRNSISVTPGASYTVSVGANTTGGFQHNSYFIDIATVRGGSAGQYGWPGGGGNGSGYSGQYGGDGGWGGGSGWAGGGGAGGYSGQGGQGSYSISGGNDGFPGSGGGGGGGAGWYDGGGGGVGLLGEGPSGAGGTNGSSDDFYNGGGGGSGGQRGGQFSNPYGGLYGGGGGSYGYGGSGAVRIIWPGTTRSFPSTNTGDL